MKVHVPLTIEEYKGELFVDVILVVEITPGEPMVRYYADGSGYPGSPPTAELVDIWVELVEDVDGEGADIDQDELYDYLENNPELWEERAFEHGYAD